MPHTKYTALNYPQQNSGRDLRIDLLRGLIMVYLIVVHFEFASIFSIFAWDRLALVSSAEGFVFLSGVVLGMVYRQRVQDVGFATASRLLWSRAFALYRISLVVIASIALLQLLPVIDVFAVTHWVDPFSKQAYPLYPASGTDFQTYVSKILLLRIGPHQYQVMGLYVVLLGIAPAALYMLTHGKTPLLLLLSWGVYLANHSLMLNLSGARFELAFPLLTWQLLFFNAMAIGYHRDRTLTILTIPAGRPIFWISLLLLSGFAFIAANNPNSLFWPWEHLSMISAETFGRFYHPWFDKTELGLGRLVNNAVVFIVAYYLLTRFWRVFKSSLGWLLIPLGQNSLYVFTLHVYFILILSNMPFSTADHFWMNSAIHGSIVLIIWGMVKYRILFRLIPR